MAFRGQCSGAEGNPLPGYKHSIRAPVGSSPTDPLLIQLFAHDLGPLPPHGRSGRRSWRVDQMTDLSYKCDFQIKLNIYFPKQVEIMHDYLESFSPIGLTMFGYFLYCLEMLEAFLNKPLLRWAWDHRYEPERHSSKLGVSAGNNL